MAPIKLMIFRWKIPPLMNNSKSNFMDSLARITKTEKRAPKYKKIRIRIYREMQSSLYTNLLYKNDKRELNPWITQLTWIMRIKFLSTRSAILSTSPKVSLSLQHILLLSNSKACLNRSPLSKTGFIESLLS